MEFDDFGVGRTLIAEEFTVSPVDESDVQAIVLRFVSASARGALDATEVIISASKARRLLVELRNGIDQINGPKDAA